MILAFSDLFTFSRASTAAYVNSAGIIASASTNTPRFDYDPTTLEARGIIIENQRTNLLLRSEEFDNASWVKNNATITANSVISPDGLNTADKLVESSDTSNKTHFVRQNVTVSIGLAYTFSVFVKAGERDQVGIQYFDGTANKYPIFSLVDGSKLVDNGIGNSWSAKKFGNGWWRFSITTTSATTSAQLYVYAASGSTNNYIGDGSSGIYIWGAQFEAGAFATSYIPTTGSQVTRLADVLSIGGSNFASFYNQAEWSVIVEAVGIDPDTTNRRAPFTIRRAAAAFQQDVYGLFYDNGSFNNLTAFLFGTSANAAPRPSPTVSEPGVGAQSKIGFAFKSGDSAFCRDGGTVGTSSAAYPAAGVMDELRIGNENALDAQGSFSGWIRSIRYFPNRLTNAELQAATL